MKKVPSQKIKMSGDIPPPRFGHSFTMVSKTKGVLFGGAVSVAGKYIITNQTYLYDFPTSTWKKLNFYNNFVPSQRAAHAATMVAEMQMVIYGGAASGSQGLLKDQLYLLDLRRQPTWKSIQVSPKNNTPGQRYGHTMVFSKPYLILFAGNSGNKVQNDVWLLNFQRGPLCWTKYQFENGRMPCPRVYHSAALCEEGKANGMMVVFGGRRENKKDHNGSQRDLNVAALNDIWGLVRHRSGVWDWNTPPRTDNYVPISRYQHLVCFVGSKLVIMGGRTNNPEEAVNYIQAYDTETAEWQKLNSISRYRHAIALYKNSKLFVHGGFQPQYASQPLDSLVSLDLSMMLSKPMLQDSQAQQTQLTQPQSQQQQQTQPFKKKPQIQQPPQPLLQPQSQLAQRNCLTPNRRQSANTKLGLTPNVPSSSASTFNPGTLSSGLRQINESQRNISTNSRIRMDRKNQRDLTPSRIINSSKNTRLSNQVIIAKGDKGGLQFQRVPVNSLMEESKKLNNMNYQDSTCSNTYDQALHQLVDNILMILMPINGVSKIINSNLFPLKKDKVYRLCHQTIKILAGESSLIGVRSPVKIFGSIYGQYTELLRFFDTFDYPDEREMQTFDYVFLGNYVDKGFNSLQTICLLMCLKIKYPQHIHLLRGKHEDIQINRLCGLAEECQFRLGENIADPQSIFQTINSMFDMLPLAAAIEDKFLCLNGGIGDVSLIDVKNIVRPIKVAESQTVMELLWSDFGGNGHMLQGYTGKKMSQEEIQKFLDDNGLDMIINTKDGLTNGVQQNKYQLSIFSVSNYPNRLNKACMLKINKALQVIPQLLKPGPISSPLSAVSQNVPLEKEGKKLSQPQNLQWINQNQYKIGNGQLTQGQAGFRRAMFQV